MKLVSFPAAPEQAKTELGEVTNSEDVLNAASDLAESKWNNREIHVNVNSILLAII